MKDIDREINIECCETAIMIAESIKQFKITISRGGTRAGKTYSMCQLILIRLITGYLGETEIPDGVCSICRKYEATLKKTVYRDFKEVLINFYSNNDRAYNIIKENKTDKTFTFGTRMVEFIGADDPQKLRGAKRNILFCNEGNELDYNNEFFQLLIRTKDKVIIDFNPSEEDIRINNEIEQKRQYEDKDVGVVVTTYKNNYYLTDEEVREIERIKKIDKQLWRVYGEGEYGKITGLIFDNRSIIESVPKEAVYIGTGLDFGFSNDPCAICNVYKWNGGIIVDEILYEKQLTNQDIDGRLSHYIEKSPLVEIIADSAEPKSIEEIDRLGWNIKPCVKGPDSINYGIQLMKQQPIMITAQSNNTIREFKKYKRKTDRNGVELPKPIGGEDHCIDGIRYVVMDKLGNKDTIDLGVYTLRKK